jgi:hypothetical protein
LSKVFERLILKKWFVPLTAKQMDPLQFAFVPGEGKGCVCALALAQHKILKFLDEASGLVRILLVDLTKAFDCATTSVTLRALSRLGMPANIIYWTHSYMSGRFQAVRLENNTSKWTEVTSGVPQGSVLGPFLFAAIIDELRPKHPNSVLIKYADDITILHFVRSSENDRLEEEWHNIKSWCANAQLRPNPAKTKIIDITTSKKVPSGKVVHEEGYQIEIVKSAKLLGVTLSDNLKWDQHVEDVTTRAARRLFCLTTLRSAGVPPKQLCQFYYSTIRSILLYGYPSWCNCNKGLWDKLIKIERRALRIIGSTDNPTLQAAAQNTCKRLILNISNHVNHPLSEIIVRCEEGRTRNHSMIASCWAKTSRFKNSLTSFADCA